MALKIIKSSQPIHVKTLVGVLYSPPGLGKTTLGFTAEKAVLLDFDKGSHRAKNRKDIVPVDKWTDVTEMKEEDFAAYKTVIVDTAGRALDALAVDIINADPKMGRGGTLSLQGYGKLKSEFSAWLKLLRSFGLDVILIAHSDENRKGDDVIERLDVQGGSKNEIYKSADFMGRISIVDGKRMLNLSPTDTAFGKNPGQLPPLEVPHYDKDPEFLASVIARTKEAINALTEEQTKVASALGEWSERIGKLATVEEFNATIEPAKTSDESVRDNVKRLLLKVAKERGFTFDPKAGTFSAPKAATATAPAPSAASPETATSATAPAAEAKAEREPGSDDGEDKGDAPTQAEIAAAAAPKATKKSKAAA